MLDPKLETDLMSDIVEQIPSKGSGLDSWVYDYIRAKISQAMTRTYQEGQRDAFLAMGKFMKK